MSAGPVVPASPSDPRAWRSNGFHYFRARYLYFVDIALAALSLFALPVGLLVGLPDRAAAYAVILGLSGSSAYRLHQTRRFVPKRVAIESETAFVDFGKTAVSIPFADISAVRTGKRSITYGPVELQRRSQPPTRLERVSFTISEDLAKDFAAYELHRAQGLDPQGVLRDARFDPTMRREGELQGRWSFALMPDGELREDLTVVDPATNTFRKDRGVWLSVSWMRSGGGLLFAFFLLLSLFGWLWLVWAYFGWLAAPSPLSNFYPGLTYVAITGAATLAATRGRTRTDQGRAILLLPDPCKSAASIEPLVREAAASVGLAFVSQTASGTKVRWRFDHGISISFAATNLFGAPLLRVVTRGEDYSEEHRLVKGALLARVLRSSSGEGRAKAEAGIVVASQVADSRPPVG